LISNSKTDSFLHIPLSFSSISFITYSTPNLIFCVGYTLLWPILHILLFISVVVLSSHSLISTHFISDPYTKVGNSYIFNTGKKYCGWSQCWKLSSTNLSWMQVLFMKLQRLVIVYFIHFVSWENILFFLLYQVTHNSSWWWKGHSTCTNSWCHPSSSSSSSVKFSAFSCCILYV